MAPATACETFPAMGTTARVWVRGRHADELVARARAELADLEARWSRFLPDSELNALNARDDDVCAVSEPTYEVLRRAYSAWSSTAGAFDPTVHDALVALGYDRTFADLAAGTAAPGTAPSVPGLAGMRFLPGHFVAIPPGVHLDLGGIGKGYGADRVATQLHQLGAQAASVDLGGDVRCVGEYAPRTR
jgi:thiamine biosynthesis lipoprotein